MVGTPIGVSGTAYAPDGYAGYFSGRVRATGGFFTGSGASLMVDHPQDPANRTLEHSFIEAPERLNVYRGNVTLDSRGMATVRLPRYFQALNRELSYQLTALDGPAPNLHVSRRVSDGGTFRIAGGSDGQEVCWIVTGARKDAWAQQHPLKVERLKKRRDRGRYLDPEAIGKPRSAAMHPAPRGPRLRRPRRVPPAA
jgi:hypothetical protein